METPAITIQRGRGKGRDFWGIRSWLSTVCCVVTPGEDPKNGLSMSDVAILADTYPQVAQETIRGTRNHYRVLAVLEKLGCPDSLLYGQRERRAA